MAINLLEQNLEAITQTLARLQKEGCNDEKILNELREERDKTLSYFNHSFIKSISPVKSIVSGVMVALFSFLRQWPSVPSQSEL